MLMCIIGGLGTIWGPIIGSFIIIVVEYFSSILIPERWPLVLGGVFVVSVMTLRGGIAQQLLRLKEKLSHGSIKG
jgi:branched-chain amino acid transport system permease protein